MQVNSAVPGDVARAEGAPRSGAAAPAGTAGAAGPPAGGGIRTDHLDLSAEARIFSANQAVNATIESLDPRRADAIRANILNGAYDSVETAQRVARAILQSGDL